MADATPTGEYEFRPMPIDDIVYRFEKAYRAGERPNIDDFLHGDGPDRWHLLVELIHSELELRLRDGEPAELAQYLARYPALAHLPNELAALLETELRIRIRAGEEPDLKAYEARFPALGPRVRETFKRVGSAPPEVPGYEVLDQIGIGGMGVVYRARQVLLRREVALKLIRHDRLNGTAGDRFRTRFRREAESLAAVSHPHVVQVFETGESGDDLFLAMELVDGPSLQKRLDTTGVLEPKLAGELMEKVAHAVHAVHTRKIMHRDLKPDNILLTAAGDPKVADFGLARADEVADGRTKAGMVIGTPEYMSPEQAALSGEAPTPLVDVYGLGAILYACLTGRAPFPRESVLATLEKVRTHPVVPVRDLRPDCPGDLETICAKCLEKDPKQRYASAQALADDLRCWLENRPISARPAGRIEKAWKWVKRNPVVAGLLAAVVLVMAAGTGVSLAFAEDARQKEIAATMARNDAIGKGNAETAARMRAETLTGSLQIDLDLRLFEEDKADLGLLRLARTVSELPESAAALREFATLTLLAWGQLNYSSHTPGAGYQESPVRFSPDNRTVVLRAAGQSDAVRLWDNVKRQLIATLGRHTGNVLAVYYADSSRAVATVDEAATIRVWDTATGAKLGTLRGAIKLGGFESRWNTVTGDRVGGIGPVGDVWLSPDGSRVMVPDGMAVRFWVTGTGTELPAPQLASKAFRQLKYSRCGRWIYTPFWNADDPAIVWDAKSAAVVWTRRYRYQTSDIPCRLVFSDSGNTLALYHDEAEETDDPHEPSIQGTTIVHFHEAGTWNRIPPRHYSHIAARCQAFEFIGEDHLVSSDTTRCTILRVREDVAVSTDYTDPIDRRETGNSALGGGDPEVESHVPVASGGFVITDSGAAYHAETLAPCLPPPGQRFAPALANRALGGRYIVTRRAILDIATGKVLPLWFLRKGALHLCVNWDARPNAGVLLGLSEEERRLVYLPLAAKVDTHSLLLWVKVITRQQLSAEGALVPLTETEWLECRLALRSSLKTADEHMLFGRAATDEFHWLRREAERLVAPFGRHIVDYGEFVEVPSASKRAELDVLSRLLAAEPTPSNRSLAREGYTVRGALDRRVALDIAEVSECSTAQDRKSFWRNNDLLTEEHPSFGGRCRLFADRPRREYELVEQWARARQRDVGGTELTLALALYRLGRYEESLAIVSAEIDADVAAYSRWVLAGVVVPPCSLNQRFSFALDPSDVDLSYLLLRAMCQHQLGRTQQARIDFDTALRYWQSGKAGYYDRLRLVSESYELIRPRAVAPAPRERGR